MGTVCPRLWTAHPSFMSSWKVAGCMIAYRGPASRRSKHSWNTLSLAPTCSDLLQTSTPGKEAWGSCSELREWLLGPIDSAKEEHLMIGCSGNEKIAFLALTEGIVARLGHWAPCQEEAGMSPWSQQRVLSPVGKCLSSAAGIKFKVATFMVTFCLQGDTPVPQLQRFWWDSLSVYPRMAGIHPYEALYHQLPHCRLGHHGIHLGPHSRVSRSYTQGRSGLYEGRSLTAEFTCSCHPGFQISLYILPKRSWSFTPNLPCKVTKAEVPSFPEGS